MTQHNLAVSIGARRIACAVAHQGSDGQTTTEPVRLGHGTQTSAAVFVRPDGVLIFGDEAVLHGQAHPERLIHGLSGRIGDPIGFTVAEMTIEAPEAFAQALTWVANRATEQLDEPPTGLVIVHPDEWGPHRLQIVSDALTACGLAGFGFTASAQAAVARYRQTASLDAGHHIAIYDFGGETFRCTIMKAGSDGSVRPAGTTGKLDDLGGADLDDAIFGYLVDSSGLSEASTLTSGNVAAHEALVRLRESGTAAKEALSSETDVTVQVMVPPVQTNVRLTRAELEQLAEPLIEHTADLLDEALDDARIGAADLDAIILIGGTSRMPRIAQRLSELFDRPIVIDPDPAASTVLGAAQAGLESAAGRDHSIFGNDLHTEDDGDDRPDEAPRQKRKLRLPSSAHLTRIVRIALIVAAVVLVAVWLLVQPAAADDRDSTGHPYPLASATVQSTDNTATSPPSTSPTHRGNHS
ncbi:Hsp70 family protein [Propionimicrobium sp. PCR01-08-3]|uniref:Hsp70 family protein n=1 Tax=Propionimicrobium sp. PCR01-08-3 TaxID=3052086 RepID=UPI00255C4984|nr:Hsp70 family protein [Propionimicrobium sp. PCR01-08-3]WIY82247.1 Hsp70 family protein [Propionimicrobium sp. PCR01-08-3]